MGLFLKRIKDDYADSADTNVISFEHLKHQFIFVYLDSMTEIGEFNKFFSRRLITPTIEISLRRIPVQLKY